MFSRKRRWLAAVGLMAALSLASPPPTVAAGLWMSPADVSGLVDRAWPWLERLGLVRRAPRKPVMAVWEHEGAMIDPNGLPAPPPPPTSSSAVSSGVTPGADGW
jgi:hypothetical protein